MSVRDVIFAAAEELLLEHGYEGFSLRQVAERIGYTPTTIYRHFADRDALIFALTDEGFREFARQLAEAAQGEGDPREALLRIGRAYVRFGLEQPVYYRLMFLQRPDYLAAPCEGSEETRMASFHVLRDAVERALPQGTPAAEGDALSDALWAAVHGIVALAITLRDFEPPRVQAMAERMLQLLGKGLRS